MTWFTSEEDLIPVAMGECLCPGIPHPTGDTVNLKRELDLMGGLAVISDLTQPGEGNAIERLGRSYLKAGIASWTFVDEKGQPIPVTKANIDRLRWTPGIYELADKAADLYGEAVLRPLALRASASSRSGQSAELTSPSPDS